MKYASIIVLAYSIVPISLFAQQGSSCSNPIPLVLDGVTRSYATSAGTAGNVVCANSGSSPVTFFSFTTGSVPEMPLLDILSPGPGPCEVAMYLGSCSGGNLETSSSMCFDDGQGLWAPAETYILSANTTYTLRIKTTNSGNISITGQFYTPPNDDCGGAFGIGPTPIMDNNACHHGGPGVTPPQLCAFTLENTAFYVYSVQSTGYSTININDIACDNGLANNGNGFQIGFFTGSCAVLTPLTCSAGSGASVTATTSSLAAGTKVIVAIDGTSGSNCRYSISATNAVPIPVHLKYFSGWKAANSNILKWASLQEFENDYYEIERSENGKDFKALGRIAGMGNSNSEKTYQFSDPAPPVKSFYRLKQVDLDGRHQYFRTIVVIRNDQPYIHLSFENPVNTNILLNLQTNFKGPVDIKIVSMNGNVESIDRINCKKGNNQFFKNMSLIPQGKYILILEGEKTRTSQVFIKTNSTLLGR